MDGWMDGWREGGREGEERTGGLRGSADATTDANAHVHSHLSTYRWSAPRTGLCPGISPPAPVHPKNISPSAPFQLVPRPIPTSPRLSAPVTVGYRQQPLPRRLSRTLTRESTCSDTWDAGRAERHVASPNTRTHTHPLSLSLSRTERRTCSSLGAPSEKINRSRSPPLSLHQLPTPPETSAAHLRSSTGAPAQHTSADARARQPDGQPQGPKRRKA